MTNLTKEVPSLELCQKMRELGFPQEGTCYYKTHNGTLFVLTWFDIGFTVNEKDNEKVLAPTVSQMVSWLPECIGDIIDKHSDLNIFPDYGSWFCAYRPCGDSDTPRFEIHGYSIADSVSKMLIHLAEQKLITPRELK